MIALFIDQWLRCRKDFQNQFHLQKAQSQFPQWRSLSNTCPRYPSLRLSFDYSLCPDSLALRLSCRLISKSSDSCDVASTVSRKPVPKGSHSWSSGVSSQNRWNWSIPSFLIDVKDSVSSSAWIQFFFHTLQQLSVHGSLFSASCPFVECWQDP